MKCFICDGAMGPYFSKKFNEFNLTLVDYWKCQHCGFVLSKTHSDMSQDEWAALNDKYHNFYLGSESNQDDPNWLMRLNEQAQVLGQLYHKRVLPREMGWVDYGCGDGKLADLLFNNSKIEVKKYDKYTKNKYADSYLSDNDLYKNKHSVVINCSVFEHILSIDSIADIFNLIDNDNGVLALHTLVREDIPPDPGWFYLLPVHCAFFTNKSMQILFECFDFMASLYHVEARMWFWFKRKPSPKSIKTLTSIPGSWVYKKGFVDYWK